MEWIRKDFPWVEGFESLGNTVGAKRFTDFRIDQLLDKAYPVELFCGGYDTREDFCNLVIVDFDYPMRLGVPTDKHYNNWFDGLSCHQIVSDYWQTASETLTTFILNQRGSRKGYGDCEDVSTLLTTLFLEKGWRAFECLGMVVKDGELLGGHGWAIFEDETGVWRLYEATLDIPPSYPEGYPVINPEELSWEVNGLTYQGLIKFNRKGYYESADTDMMKYALKLSLAKKETRRKYDAISQAWGQKVKPMKKAGILSRLRWR
jgi:hypothetical protein